MILNCFLEKQMPNLALMSLAALAKAGAPRCYNHRADLSHSTIYQQLTPQALQFLLPPASPPPAEYGFKVQCSSK